MIQYRKEKLRTLARQRGIRPVGYGNVTYRTRTKNVKRIEQGESGNG